MPLRDWKLMVQGNRRHVVRSELPVPNETKFPEPYDVFLTTVRIPDPEL
jgi:hypothetical protein